MGPESTGWCVADLRREGYVGEGLWAGWTSGTAGCSPHIYGMRCHDGPVMLRRNDGLGLDQEAIALDNDPPLHDS